MNASGCEMPNAFYRYTSHRVMVCPQIMNLPEGALFEVLAHELGHAIDPCATSYAYAQVEKGSYRRLNSENEDGGAPGGVLLKNISLDKLPTQNILTCLQSKESMGILLPSKADVLAKLDDAIKKTPDDPYLQSKRDRADKQYDKFKYCSEVSGSGHIQEAFADWVASEALNKKLTNVADSSSRNKIAFESQLFFASLDCDNIKEAARAQMKPLQDGSNVKCVDYEKMYEKQKESSANPEFSHPKTEARVERLMLAKPEMKKALNCSEQSSSIAAKECK